MKKFLLVAITMTLMGCDGEIRQYTKEQAHNLAMTKTVGDAICANAGGFKSQTWSKVNGTKWNCYNGKTISKKESSEMNIPFDKNEYRKNYDYYINYYRTDVSL